MLEIVKQLRAIFEGPRGTVLFVAVVIIAAYLFLQIIGPLFKMLILGGALYFGYLYFTRKK